MLSKVDNALDMWVAFLTRHELLTSDDLPGELNKSELSKALHVMDVMHLSKIERDEYESHLKWLRAETGAIATVEARAREEGKEEGRAEGREEGISIGEARVIERTAMNMLKEQLSVSVIASVTGLASEEIVTLKERL